MCASGSLVLNRHNKLGVFENVNIGKSEAKIEKSGNNIKLLFNADKLLQILTKLSSASKISTIKTIGSVAEGYDGMLIGFELSK